MSTHLFSGLNNILHADKICQIALASSLSHYADFQMVSIVGQIQSLQGLSRDRPANLEQLHPGRIDKLECIARAWCALALESTLDSPTEEDLHYQRLLESGFEKYLDRFLEQRNILEGGILVQRVKLALSRMHAVRHLQIHDFEEKLPAHAQRGFYFSKFGVGPLDDEELLEILSKQQPITYNQDEYDGVTLDNTSLIPALLSELDTINFRQLVSLEIEMGTTCSIKGLSAAGAVYSKIQAALPNLKSFRFIHFGPVFPRSLDEIETLRDSLGSIIVLESLESLAVELNLWNDAESPLEPDQLPLISLIKARPDWPHLSSLSLKTLHIEHSDLTYILSCVNSTQGCVGLHKIHLLDGSWATILDLLREKHSWANLASPSGAECEAMSVEEYERIFGPYSPIDIRTQEEEVSSGPKEAESYIRGWQNNNPLNVPPEIDQD